MCHAIRKPHMADLSRLSTVEGILQMSEEDIEQQNKIIQEVPTVRVVGAANPQAFLFTVK